MTEFKALQEALNEEFRVEERLKHIPLMEDEVLVTPFVHENDCSLQLHGWEIVLLKDGTYYINDTTGG